MFAHLYIASCFILQLGIRKVDAEELPIPSVSLNLLEISKKYILVLSQGANEPFLFLLFFYQVSYHQ